MIAMLPYTLKLMRRVLIWLCCHVTQPYHYAMATCQRIKPPGPRSCTCSSLAELEVPSVAHLARPSPKPDIIDLKVMDKLALLGTGLARSAPGPAC